MTRAGFQSAGGTDRKDTFPMLYGAQGSEQDVLSGYREMAQQLSGAGLKIKSASMSPRHAWQLVLDNDVGLNSDGWIPKAGYSVLSNCIRP